MYTGAEAEEMETWLQMYMVVGVACMCILAGSQNFVHAQYFGQQAVQLGVAPNPGNLSRVEYRVWCCTLIKRIP